MYETDTLVFGQENDQVRALGLMAMLASVTPLYAKDELFRFTHTMGLAIEQGCYGLLYERADKNSIVQIPVALITWGFFSRPVASIFENRLRLLERGDFNSGKQLWLLDIIAPFGHQPDLMRAIDETVGKGHEEYKLSRIKENGLRTATMPNQIIRGEKKAKAKAEAAMKKGPYA